MGVLLLAEVTDGELNMDATAKAVAAAAKLGDVTALCAGASAAAAGEAAARSPGLPRCWWPRMPRSGTVWRNRRRR